MTLRNTAFMGNGIKEKIANTFFNSSIESLSQRISSGEISPVELVEASLSRIKELNQDYNAFITVTENSAIQEAKQAAREISEKKYRGPLHGIPFGLKDLIYVKGVKSTSGSKILSDFVPDYDSTVVKKLREAGAIIVGMNNTHEFACGLTNVNPHYGYSKNPWDKNRISGGSSGGSAVSVSTGMVVAAIGTDTSGSIRVPSSLCGLFGLKPTYGRVSKYGVMPLASSLDHIGPIVRSTWDAAAVLQAIAGFDEMDDSTSETPVPNYIELISEEISDEFKVGIPNQYFFDLIDPKVKDVFEKFVDKLNNCEIITRHVDLDETDKIRDTWKAIRLGESAAVHDKWMKTRPNDYGDDVISMLTKGLEITATEYINAKKRMGKIRESIITAMKGFDALIVPTTIIAATLVDQKSVDIDGKDVEVYQALSRQTIAFSTAGLPVLNVPAGLVEGKLPVGVQLIGRPFDEETLFKIARKYELHYKITELFTPLT